MILAKPPLHVHVGRAVGSVVEERILHVQVSARNAVDRDPTPKELDTALTYLDKGTLAQFAQALLASNEVIFWP